MMVIIRLCDRKGMNCLWWGQEEIKSITCMSDAAQQLPKLLFYHDGKTYGFHRLDDDGATYYERQIICV